MIILFVLSLGGYVGLRFYHELNLDKIAPEITCDKEAIEVSVEDPKEKLLAGVSALDDKDGDLTKEVIVENIGPFMSEGLLEHYSDISEMMYPGYILEELVPAVYPSEPDNEYDVNSLSKKCAVIAMTAVTMIILLLSCFYDSVNHF